MALICPTLTVFFLTQAACSFLLVTPGSYSLVDHFDQAQTFFEGGRYPSFVEEAVPLESIDISNDVRRSLTPPFPSRIAFEVDVPPAAFLNVSPALVMTQLVRRARMEFLVWVEHEGERTQVFAEPFRLSRANEWHHRRIDLTSWSGKRVTLELETRSIPAREDVLWADRIQTVWGEPIIVSSPSQQAAAMIRRWATSMSEWLKRQASAAGFSPDDTQTTFLFALNLLLGGIASIFIRELYKRYGTTVSNREEFANLFPLFTLTTIVVIFIVQSSLALSLGLIGALSIVRFRSAIKSPEELVYLLFCVSVGLALGANQKPLAMVSITVVTAFVLVNRIAHKPAYERNLLLTMSGNAEHFFDPEGSSVAERVSDITKGLTIQRLDRDDDQVRLRGIITVKSDEDTTQLITKLREKLPHFEFSYSDLDDIL